MCGHSYVTDTEHALLGGWASSEYRDEILKYDADTQKWDKVGRMSEGRQYHAVSTVANKDLTKYCNI